MRDILQKDKGYLVATYGRNVDVADHLDEYGDIDMSNSKLHIGASDSQHIYDLLVIQKGELKHAPHLGVYVKNYQDDDNREALMREIRRNIERDGAKVNSITFDEKFYIDAKY